MAVGLRTMMPLTLDCLKPFKSAPAPLSPRARETPLNASNAPKGPKSSERACQATRFSAKLAGSMLVCRPKHTILWAIGRRCREANGSVHRPDLHSKRVSAAAPRPQGHGRKPREPHGSDGKEIKSCGWRTAHGAPKGISERLRSSETSRAGPNKAPASSPTPSPDLLSRRRPTRTQVR